MKVVVGSTLGPYKAQCYADECSWLRSADSWPQYPEIDVEFFAALEVHPGQRSEDVVLVYERTIANLRQLGGEYWTFMVDTGATKIDGHERLARITTGRNLVTERAVRTGADWCLFLDSDIEVPVDSLAKLLEMEWPIVGGHLPSYCRSGPVATYRAIQQAKGGYDDSEAEMYPFPVQVHWSPAGFLLVARDIFTQVRWRTDPDRGLSDDPAYARDALRLGWPTLVRHDLIGRHDPLVDVTERGHRLDILR